MSAPVVPEVPEGGNTKTPSGRVNAAKNWCFTLNNYTEEDIESLRNCGAKKYVFQEEVGEECGTPHLQGHMEFETKIRWSSLKLTKKISWRVCRDVAGSRKYCQKKETRAGRVFRKGIPIMRELDIITVLRPWQQTIVNIVESDTSDRTVHWFWETEGNYGKTVLCKYLVHHHDAIVLSGKNADCLYAIQQFVETNGYYPSLCIFDIPRDSMEQISYTAIEKVKDGIFFSGKFKSGMVMGNSPVVIVFANEPPNENRLSGDRWNVCNLRGESNSSSDYDDR
nr:MAG: replication associated protein [Cressdnaviricota sp.]